MAPTLLALLGIDAAPLPYVGRNLFGPDANDANVPVPRPYGDWLDARHLFLSRGATRICYDVARRNVDAENSCAAADHAAREERDVSRLIVVDDLQERLREPETNGSR
jgi:hypothetical protein